MRTITERIAKRIRRRQPWKRGEICDALILSWARQYGLTRRYWRLGRLL